MRLTMFQSDKGDCLLLTAADDTRMLIDGGMRASYQTHVAPALGRLRGEGARLDVVYVSHIDEDHIAGVLQLVDDAVAWRVHEFQLAHDNPTHPAPRMPRPPEIGGIWHNAFHEQVGQNAGPIESMLAATATILSGGEDEVIRRLIQAHPTLPERTREVLHLTSKEAQQLREAAIARQEWATSVKQAIQLSRRVGDAQLGIPLNRPAAGKLMLARAEEPPIDLGSLRIFIIGPFAADLANLRRDWNKWLKANADALEEIERRAQRDQEQLGANEILKLMVPKLGQAVELGRREKVTPPNLASLMLLVEENGRSVILTGDGHHRDIIQGLRQCGKLDDGRIHVDVLKVQHHGSEHNADEPFFRSVTADHYIFCGNGKHENPDLNIVEALVRARAAPGDERKYHLWFSSAPESVPDDDADNRAARAHLVRLEALVAELATQHSPRVEFAFNQRSSFEVEL